MLYVTAETFALADSGNLDDLKQALQNAIALEHATMPPYLYALYSLGDANSDIRRALRAVVQEEMLHMLLAGNILKAIGGRPVVDSPHFVVDYPCTLPGIAGTFAVPLERFSTRLVEEKFMEIERPEHNLEFPVHLALEVGIAAEPPRTIGEFYRRIRGVFEEAGADALIRVTEGQPEHPFFAEKQTIRSAADAVAAINVIVDQGEGTVQDPFFRGDQAFPDDDRLAHYYRFAELVRGRIKRNPTPPEDPKPEDLYFYDASDPVAFDSAAVLPLRTNPRSADFAEGSEARQRLDQFNRRYTQVLQSLDAALNGQPDQLSAAVLMMRNELRTAAKALVVNQLEDGTRPGPSFEYLA